MEGNEIWISFRRIWISIPPDFDIVPSGFDFLPTDFEFLPPVLEVGKGRRGSPSACGVAKCLGPAQPFEKARFAEGKTLRFASPPWIFFPPLRGEGHLSGHTELDDQSRE